MSGIKKQGTVIGFGKWRDFTTLKIKTGDNYAKRRVSILEKNAILLKRGKKNVNEFFEMYCKAPTMDTYADEIRVQEAMEIAFKEGIKFGKKNCGHGLKISINSDCFNDV